MTEQGATTDSATTGGQLRLNSLENSRRSFARIIRMYIRGEIDRITYRDLCYGLSAFLGYWKTELETDIEERLTALEERT